MGKHEKYSRINKAVIAFVFYLFVLFSIFALILPKNASDNIAGMGFLIILALSIYIAIKAYKLNTLSLLKIFNLNKKSSDFKIKKEIEPIKDLSENKLPASHFSNEDKTSDKKEDADIEITYEDASGRITQRKLMLTNITDEYIEGWCYLRDDIRTFRIDRIKELVDLETGEIINNDINKYLQNKFKVLKSNKTISDLSQKIKNNKNTKTYTINIDISETIKKITSPEYKKQREKEIKEAQNYLNIHKDKWYSKFDESLFYNDQGKFVIPKYKLNNCNLKLKLKDISDRKDFWSVYDKEEKENFTIKDFNRDGDYVFEYEISPEFLLESIKPELLIESGICNTRNEAKTILKIIKEFHEEDEKFDFYIEKKEKKNYENLDFVNLILLDTDEEKEKYLCYKYTKNELLELCKNFEIKCKKSSNKNSIVKTLIENNIINNIYKVSIHREKFNKTIEKIGQIFVDELKNCIKDFHPYAKKAIIEALIDTCQIEEIRKILEKEQEQINVYCENLIETGYKV